MIRISNVNLLQELDSALLSGNRPTQLKTFVERLQIQNIPGLTMKHVRIFNPQVTEIDGKILKIRVARDKIQVILAASLQPLVRQKVVIMQWDTPSTEVLEEVVEAEMHFFVEKQPPLSITSYLLLEFEELKMC